MSVSPTYIRTNLTVLAIRENSPVILGIDIFSRDFGFPEIYFYMSQDNPTCHTLGTSTVTNFIYRTREQILPTNIYAGTRAVYNFNQGDRAESSNALTKLTLEYI